MVVAIIALLVAILLPSLEEARGVTKKVVCQTNLRQIGLAFYLYADNYNGLFPEYHDFDTGNGTWMDQLINAGLVDRNWVGTRNTIFNCPAREEPPAGGFKYHFGMNIQVAYKPPGAIPVPKLADVVKPSRRMMVGDARSYWLWNGMVGSNDIYPHKDGMNIVFADGSVDWWLGPLHPSWGTWDFPW